MACSYILDDKLYGKIEVNASARSQRITLRVAPGGKMRISCPDATSPKELATFLSANRQAIDRILEKGKNKTPSRQLADLSDGATFVTRSHRLSISSSSPDNRLHLCVKGNEGTIAYPKALDDTPEERHSAIKKLVDHVLRMEAKSYLPHRVYELAQANGLRYDHVDLRNMSSRWGSCSSKGRICLNIQLMRVPDHLIDMVILHELNHTVHMDHSKAFWADLDRLCGGRIAELNKEMKNWNTEY